MSFVVDPGGGEKTFQETISLVAVLSLDVDRVSNEHSNH